MTFLWSFQTIVNEASKSGLSIVAEINEKNSGCSRGYPRPS